MQDMHHRARMRRDQLELTQRQVAEVCQVTQQAYEKFERGETKRPRYLYELAKALNVSPEWLRTGEEGSASDKNPVAAPLPRDAAGGREGIPVYSYFINPKGRQSASFEDTDVIDRVASLPTHENTTGALALFVQGNGLAPFFPHGTVVYLDRHKFPTANKPCLCLYGQGMRILLYLGTKGGIHNFRFIDSGKHKRLKINAVKAIYRVVGALYP